MVEELLPLMDDLERALKTEAAGEAADAYRRGVELIHRQLGEILRKRGVRPIEALGADFDPYYPPGRRRTNRRKDGAKARSSKNSGGDTCSGDRLLRPSMVKVAKG